MTDHNSENYTDELIFRVKSGASLERSEISGLIYNLNSLPKSEAPKAEYSRIRNQILDRISVPQTQEVQETTFGGIFSSIPRMLKMAGTLTASLLLVTSLTVGTAVAALESVPGSPIYPLKKAVENVQLRLAKNDEQKANLQIKFASKRLEELEVVLQKSEQGEISEDKVEKIVAQTVQNLKNTTEAATKASASAPKVETLTKIVSLSNKQTAVLKSASIKSEGQAKVEIEKALETSQTSKEQAIENIERAGLVVEEQPVIIEEKIIQVDKVTTTGKITAVDKTSINIGTAKFVLTNDTKYVNIEKESLAVDQLVDIQAQIVGKETVATTITLIKSELKTELNETSEETKTETQAPEESN